LNWLAIVFWVISNAPELFELIRKVIALLKSMPKNKQSEIKTKLAEAIQSKDKSKVETVLKDTCTVGCNSEIKKE